MESTDPRPETQGKRLEDALSQFLESKSNKSPNYRLNLERVVTEWIDFCADRGVIAFEDVSELTMERYASYLSRRVEAGDSDDVDGGIAASTAWAYYDYVSSFLLWAVRRSHLEENPADKALPRERMPGRPSTGEYDRQFWSPDQRSTVLEFLNRRAESALERPIAPKPLLHRRLRDRAFVATIAYSGVRGGEILNDHNDPRRSGITWDDINFDDGFVLILGKNQNDERAQLPAQAIRPLRRWYDAYDPPSDSWPVFPSFHVPTLSRRLADALGAYKRDQLTDDLGYWSACLEAGVEPPSFTTEAGRSIMRDLCDCVDVPDLEDDEYLTLHGGRRGTGETLYRELGAAHAQRTLRHADPKTTSAMYQHIDVSELADMNTDVFDDE